MVFWNTLKIRTVLLEITNTPMIGLFLKSNTKWPPFKVKVTSASQKWQKMDKTPPLLFYAETVLSRMGTTTPFDVLLDGNHTNQIPPIFSEGHLSNKFGC